MAARFGNPRMLMTGLGLQIAGLLLLSLLDPAWGAVLFVSWVVAAHGIAGVARDITKTASNAAIKATSEGGSGQLFRWGRCGAYPRQHYRRGLTRQATQLATRSGDDR